MEDKDDIADDEDDNVVVPFDASLDFTFVVDGGTATSGNCTRYNFYIIKKF